MPVTIRPAQESDIPAMAEIRASDWGDKAFWIDRITRYKHGEHNPRQSLPERALFVAVDQETVVGFVAGHRTRRFDCDAELQWINVAAGERGQGIAGGLMARIGGWFLEQNAHRICVNVAPENANAHRLYAKWGAQPLGPQWMVWDDARSMGTGKPPNDALKKRY